MVQYDATTIPYDSTTTEYDEGSPAEGKSVEFLNSANAEFLSLQSGFNARPFYYMEMILSGSTAILACSFADENWLIDGGLIDREKPAFPSDRSNIISSDVTIKADNSTRRFSPLATGSVFFTNTNYLRSVVNYWAGFQKRDVSGTALTAVLIQRGSFLLDSLRIDSSKSVAFMRLKDKFSDSLETIIGEKVDVSGTAIDFITTGVLSAGGVFESLLVTGGGLASGDLSIANSSFTFENKPFSNQSVAQAISLVAEASDSFAFTNRKGQLSFQNSTPTFGTAPVADFTATESNFMMDIFYEQNFNDRLNKVAINFSSGSASVVSETTGATGNSVSIDNSVIESTADAISIASRFRDKFSGQITRVEVRSIWLPSIDIGDRIQIHSDNVELTGKTFEVYRLQEEPTNGTMRLSLISDNITGKWGFASHATGLASATEPHSAVFAGSGSTESGGWQGGWAFAAGETTGFDADGDADGTPESGVTSSGAGGTGIEIAFQAY